MPTTNEELVTARSWIGNTEDEDVFNERFDTFYGEVIKEGDFSSDVERRAEALNRAIEQSLRAQLSALALDSPASASVEGTSYSNQQNMITAQKNLDSFTATYGSGKLRISRLTRNVSR